MERLIDSAVLHVEPSAASPSSHLIPIERLIEIAHGINEVISGLADSNIDNSVDDRSRASLTDSAKEHYRLFVGPAVEGSYALPCELYDTRSSSENNDQLFPGGELTFESIGRIISFANDGDRESFYENVRSPVVASKVFKGIEKLAPKEGEKVFLSQEAKGSHFEISSGAKTNVIEWESMCEGPFEVELLATISAIDFDASTLKVKPLKSGKKITVPYDEEIGSQLLCDLKGKQWKLLCDATYSPNGQLASVSEVRGIEELVLRTISIDSFQYGDDIIRFADPLAVEETLDEETGQLFVAMIPDLAISVFSESQSVIRECLLDELANKWGWIVLADDSQLTYDALAVKQAFLRMTTVG